ncbi:hypothetical protein [Halococcus sp. IIIV-5B]|uniref:hypothetical protein n=1 Tax=Halococcus sp. IIIV-5B TaxID=2321230 RepID=UPI000E76BA99|nr:hypothetical protein [Halococcus sp. IIIV-5B]RJT07026.1 hypothetical protein D3261_03115 [Halococcus sp. IIIV-5B]
MEATSWIGALVGVGCTVLTLFFGWLTFAIVDGVLHDPYTTLNGLTVMLLTSFVSGLLLFSSLSIVLLTGKYQSHKKAFQATWSALALLTVLLFLWVWAAAAVVE